ncbi:phage head closure protein [Comamonas odontotermitis]|uniref:phage head closure protein n=1 Tax=Comamonas odontotermitis TaxID=379895 RepID=UPI00366B0829
MTTAGQLRDRIKIQKRTGGVNEVGEPLPDGWEDYVSLWANVRHQSGSEAIRSGADTSTVKASVRVRWRTDLTAGMQMIHLGQIYDIEASLPGSDRVWTDLLCRLVV